MSSCLFSKRVTIILFALCFSCFCILPSSVYAADPCQNSCTVTVQGINATYKPGETISGTVNYSIRNNSQCPSCVQQILIGIVDASNQGYDVICVYNDSPKTCPAESIGKVSFSLTVPSNPGTYHVIMSNYLQNSCIDAIRFFHDSAKVSKIIATIQVSGSDAVTSNIKTSSPNIIDILGVWIKQALPWIPWIIISALLIAMFGVLWWRKLVHREDGGAGLSFKTEINIVSAITLGLVILTIYVFFQQQFITYLIVIGIVIIIYILFKICPPTENGEPGITVDERQLPKTLLWNGEYCQRDSIFSRKVDATSRTRELKRTGYFAFVRTRKGKQTYPSGRVRYGYTHAVYSRPK
jgi:hypothetical protein